MDIRFVSSLSSEDESAVAGLLLSAVVALLDRLPIAYSLKVVTSGGRQFDRMHCPEVTSGGIDAKALDETGWLKTTETASPPFSVDPVHPARPMAGRLADAGPAKAFTGTPGMAAGTRASGGR